MELPYIKTIVFEKQDYTVKPLNKGEYEGCTFINCDLSKCDLSNMEFADCLFDNCNISNAKLSKTAMRNVQFKNCKLLGLRFDECSEFLFEVAFENCVLNFSSFYKVKMKKTKFKDCTIHEADFTETDLTEAVFANCDMHSATFENTILEKTDLRTAYNYSIDPQMNRIKKAKFGKEGLAGLLYKFDIEIE